MSTSLQIKQTFFPDLPDSKFSYGLTLIWHSLTHGSTISLPLFLPRDYWQWHGLDKDIHLIGFRSRTAHIGLPQPIFAYPGSSASFFQAWTFAFGERMSVHVASELFVEVRVIVDLPWLLFDLASLTLWVDHTFSHTVICHKRTRLTPRKLPFIGLKLNFVSWSRKVAWNSVSSNLQEVGSTNLCE